VLEPKWGKVDTRYFCVSVENIDFRPIELNELKAKMAAEK
jgi:hypothetical protein